MNTTDKNILIEEQLKHVHDKHEKKRLEKEYDRGVIWEVFVRDLKRIFTNPIIALMMLAILAFPSLYAWCGIGANWDPYSNLYKMPIGVVIEDQPGHSDLLGEVYLGDTIRQTLENNRSLDWQFYDYDTAMQKVTFGSIYAVLVIPSDFSQSICNLFAGESVRDYVHFDCYINERQNQAAVKVGDTGASKIEAQINEKFTAIVGTVIAQKLSDTTNGIVNKSKGLATTLADRLNMVANTVSGFKDTANAAGRTLNASKESLAGLQKTMSDLQSQMGGVQSTLDTSRVTINNARQNIGKLIKELEETVPELEILIEVFKGVQEDLDNASIVIDQLSGSLINLSSTITKLSVTLDSAMIVLNKTQMLSGGLDATLDNVVDQLRSASLKLSSAGMGSSNSILTKILNLNASEIGKFIAAPVQLRTEVINPIKNYGTGIAPFFSCITFWVAGFILIALIKTEVDPPKNKKITPKQAYISRGMVYSVIAILQGIVCTVGELIMGIGVENPVMFVLTGAIASFVFVNIIYMLAACFKHVGKAFAVVLVIMQIPGSSGMYPIELMPGVFQAIHPFLPFTHAINALRETLVNMEYAYWGLCILILGIMWLIAMFIGVFARRALANLNMLFDRMLSDTDLIECETENHIEMEKDNTIEHITNVIAASDDYGEKVDKTIESFEKKYKDRSRFGVIGMAVVPQVFLIAMCIVFCFIDVDINTKIILMLVWLLMQTGFAIYIIIIEFMHVRLKKQHHNKAMDNKEFSQTVKKEYIDYA